MLERYGVEYTAQSPELRLKMQKSCMDKFGVDIPMKSQQIQQKQKDTLMQKYSVSAPMQSEEIKEKSKKTFRQNYGTDWGFQSETIKEKIRNTNKQRYGQENISQTKFRSRNQKYEYNGYTFDSSWELAFYVYHMDFGINVIREPTGIEYTYNNEVHVYFPDFEIQGQLYEIKGSQFFKKPTIYL